MLLKITILPGDGIGPEVIEEAVRVLDAITHAFGHEVSLARKNIGGAALLASEDPLPPDTLQACISSSAVLLGAVGAPSFDNLPAHLRPEAGLLRLRRELGAFANLRPAICYPALEDCSPLRAEVVRGTNILIVRELLGGLYFGEPRLLHGPTGDRAATNTMRYHEPEVQRIARIAFDLARTRRHSIVSVDKANVLECSRLWREVVTEIGRDYPDVKLSHMYVDSAAMALVLRPCDFDVLLTENMFGWHPPALGDRLHCMSRCMVRLPILLDKVLLTHWVQFFQSPCLCAIPSTWNARRLALSQRYPKFCIWGIGLATLRRTAGSPYRRQTWVNG